MRTGTGGLAGSYSFKSRFEEGEGTNPEELIGAAHAGCFSMAFSKVLADAGFPPNSIDTTANVHLDKVDGAFTVTRIRLDTTGDVPGITADEFSRLAEAAKANCPISRLLTAAEITVDAKLA